MLIPVRSGPRKELGAKWKHRQGGHTGDCEAEMKDRRFPSLTNGSNSLAPIGCVVLGKLLNSSEPLFFHIKW